MLAVVALTLLFVAPPAEAWTVTDVIRDCSKNGKLSHPYPPSLIRKAREQLPADIDEYTDCRDLLATPTSSGSGGSDNSGGGGGSDQSGAGGGGGGAGGSGGGSGATTSATPAAPPAPPSPAELKQLDAARQGDGGEPVSVGGSPVTPGTAGMTTGAVSNGLPSTLLIVLILLAVLVAVVGGPLLRGRYASGTGSSFQRVFTRRRS